MTAASAEFSEHVRLTAEKVLRLLDEPSGGRTAWELKLELKVPNAVLFLALGRLAREGRIEIEPQELTYRVRRNVPATASSQA